MVKPLFVCKPDLSLAVFGRLSNWFSLDQGDTDLGGVSATLVDVPGATPSQLVLALGKDGMAYLLDRNNLGGVTAPVASENLPTAVRGQSAATYHTSQGTYFVFHTENNAVAAYKVTATSPPTIVPAWSVSQTGLGSAWVTSTDGTNNAIVWVAGAGGDGRLHAYDGDTGNVVYAGGGAERDDERHTEMEYRHCGSRPHLLPC